MASKKAKSGDNSDGMTITTFVSQIESTEAEIAQSKEAIKATLSDAAAKGFDPKAIKQIVKDRRADMEKTAKLRATVKRYMRQMSEQLGELGEWAGAQMAAQKSADNSRPAKFVVPATDENGNETVQ